MRELFFIALVLACPLIMIWMMRGGHGHGAGGGHGDHSHGAEPREASMDDLRRRRDELDRLIEEREQFQPEETERKPTPAGQAGGR